MQDDDENDVADAGLSADIPDETFGSDADFLATIQVRLAREGWELRGTCSIRRYFLKKRGTEKIIFNPKKNFYLLKQFLYF